jgi:hypothetical protein
MWETDTSGGPLKPCVGLSGVVPLLKSPFCFPFNSACAWHYGHSEQRAFAREESLYLLSGASATTNGGEPGSPARDLGATLKPFENVNVYPLVARILGLDAPKVDGSLIVLSGILKDAPQD